MEQVERKILVTEKGNQIAVEATGGVIVSAFLPDDQVIEEIKVDVSDDEFEDIKQQAVTNDIPADILTERKVE